MALPIMRFRESGPTHIVFSSCSFEHLSLTKTCADHHAHCHSYVWGDPDNCEPIKLNGEIHLVTLNLYKALCTFIEDEDAAIRGYLWVDALCINQVDVDERGHQVSIMSPIFRQAQTVHICKFTNI